MRLSICPCCLQSRAYNSGYKHARCSKLMQRTREKVIAESDHAMSHPEVTEAVNELVWGVYANKEQKQ